MPIKTKRWNDPAAPDDGFRILICRFRPRGVSKARETWNEWWPDLGPSRALLADFKGRGEAGPQGVDWTNYRQRYLTEMEQQIFRIRALRDRLAAGETITLLCSSTCHDPARCHRTILAEVLQSKPAAPRKRAPRA